ncbi:ADP-ribose pyrophosphatase [hydrothermal vent metagenome]|uniref:ADP-ribose pyrophosphatase n=1 Tax=hydrothermal vent metagenome TaxID=652676 RepID=A0A3B0U5H8_9ZZZZ
MYTYKYPRPALTVDAIVIARVAGNSYLLLIERGTEPFKGKWALPGGFVEIDELLEAACIRELKEETGFEAGSMQQFKVFDAIGRDPRHRTISVVFYTFTGRMVDVKGKDDAANAKWFNISNLPELAFDHLEIIRLFIQEHLDA